MMAAKKSSCLATLFLTALFATGCGAFRHSIIPQSRKGPHGGPLVLIDQRIPEYVECAVIPGAKEWLFQVFFYDRDLKPKDISGNGQVVVTLPDGTEKEVSLWNTRPFFWSKGIGHIENKLDLGDAKEFAVQVHIWQDRRRSSLLEFRYPY